jgi:hypothetical protein
MKQAVYNIRSWVIWEGWVWDLFLPMIKSAMTRRPKVNTILEAAHQDPKRLPVNTNTEGRKQTKYLKPGATTISGNKPTPKTIKQENA